MKSPLALLLVACALVLAGCEEKTALRPPCPKGQLCMEFGNSTELGSLDPHKVNSTWEFEVVQNLLVGLVDMDPAGQPAPGMATHWETSKDGLTWTFHLRDANWSDGVPVTADDFVFALQRLFDPKIASEQASQYYAIKNSRAVNGGKAPPSALGVHALDPHTVEIKLEHPWLALLDYADSVPMSPVPKHMVERWGDAWVKPGRFVGNGPYLPVSWVLGDRLVVQKNPRYFDANNICLDRITYYPTTDAVSAERRVKRGELDLNNYIQGNRVSFLRQPGQMPAYVRSHPYIGLYYLAYNVKSVPALRDVRVRQALGMAIDREFITNKLIRGGQTPAYHFVPPGMVDYSGGPLTYWAKWPLERRQSEARRLLAQAGYGPGHPLKLEIKHRNSADPMLMMPAIQADWRSIGVDVSLTANEVQIAYSSYNAGDFEVADAGWVGGADAMGFLYINRSDIGTQNYGSYKNLRYDQLLTAADNESDDAKRQALLRQAEQILLDDAPVTPIYFTSWNNLVSPNVTGWVDNVIDTHKARFLCFKDAAARRAGTAAP